MEINRRELCGILTALYSTSLIAGDSALGSTTFRYEDLPVKKTDAGEGRSVLRGATPTGEQVEVHETSLRPGSMPHAPHRHKHSEFWLVREGTVEITINGQKHQLGPGSVGFAASNDEHGIKNVGTGTASYFVVAIGAMS